MTNARVTNEELQPLMNADERRNPGLPAKTRDSPGFRFENQGVSQEFSPGAELLGTRDLELDWKLLPGHWDFKPGARARLGFRVQCSGVFAQRFCERGLLTANY
jgi:hypothetical protein